MNLYLLTTMLIATFFGSALSLQAQHFSSLPKIYEPSATYRLEVAGKSMPIVEYTDQYDYTQFTLDIEEVEAKLTLPGALIESFTISPQKLGVVGRLEANILHFKILKGQYLIVKLNSKRALVIAADSADKHKPASRGHGIFNVLDEPYAADSAGAALSTQAIQRAINDASNYNKGIVYVPKGVYRIGNLELKSNLNLFFEPGAVLLFSPLREDHSVDARKFSQNRDITRWIYTSGGAKNIKIFGSGTLDGNGQLTTRKINLGNHILSILGATNVEINGPIIRDSGAWAILPARSENVRLKNLKIFNRFDMGENDGIDVIESQNIRITHVIGIGLDDPFSTKTWQEDTDLCRGWPEKPRPLKNVVFEDCIAWTYCYGFKVGQGVLQAQSDIYFKNSVVYDAAVGIGIHHKWGQGPVRNVCFKNIDIERLSFQNDDHRTWAVFLMQNGDKLGSGAIEDILIRDIIVRDAGKSSGKIRGWSAQKQISNLKFRKILMPGMKRPATSLRDLNMTNVAFTNNVSVLTR